MLFRSGERHHVGTFDSRRKAAIAYDRARVKLGPPTSKKAKRPRLNFARASWADTIHKCRRKTKSEDDEDEDEDDEDEEEEEEEDEDEDEDEEEDDEEEEEDSQETEASTDDRKRDRRSALGDRSNDSGVPATQRNVKRRRRVVDDEDEMSQAL